MSDQPTTETSTPERTLSPAEQGRWSVPPETAALLKDIDKTCSAVLQRLGAIEVDYLAAKFPLLEELKQKRATFKNVLDEAARKAGLDIDRSRWSIDTRTMTLVRDP